VPPILPVSSRDGAMISKAAHPSPRLGPGAESTRTRLGPRPAAPGPPRQPKARRDPRLQRLRLRRLPLRRPVSGLSGAGADAPPASGQRRAAGPGSEMLHGGPLSTLITDSPIRLADPDGPGLQVAVPGIGAVIDGNLTRRAAELSRRCAELQRSAPSPSL
jgi:hypothetical protein